MNNDNHTDSESLLEQITKTVLYEGYSLYPYYRSSGKNVKPVPFGAVYPQNFQQHNPEVHSTTQTQCVIDGPETARVDITVRFLHLRNKRLLKINHNGFGENQFQSSDSVEGGNDTHNSGWVAVEREIPVGSYALSELNNESIQETISCEDEESQDLIYDDDGNVAGNVFFNQSAIEGDIMVSASQLETGFRITVEITNTTPVDQPEACSRDDVYGLSFLSTHTILKTDDGVFISQTDPDPEWQDVIEESENINTWPILVEKDDKTMLSSPIVLYDHPEIAPESMGDMFDSTEIEEALLLHMATLPDKEKERIDDEDPKMKAMMERVESVTPEEIMKLHGGFKESKPDSDKPQNKST